MKGDTTPKNRKRRKKWKIQMFKNSKEYKQIMNFLKKKNAFDRIVTFDVGNITENGIAFLTYSVWIEKYYHQFDFHTNGEFASSIYIPKIGNLKGIDYICYTCRPMEWHDIDPPTIKEIKWDLNNKILLN